ncbi:MAG: GNAT family N-acetyltransferase [Dehalococcoidia bacterium]|nr:GNAT family N-acetyltransferase [Dehalococcoidia bacterium]
MIVRDARETDLPAITDLYNAWIPTHTITWTETIETYEQRAAWFVRQRREGFPVLVADDGGEVAGYASYAHFRGDGKWPGYLQTVEHSIHVREDHWGRGIGRALIEGLVERARAADIHVLVAAIDGENEASIRFHARLGFVEVARMPETGQKFGRWLDLVLMQRILDSVRP